MSDWIYVSQSSCLVLSPRCRGRSCCWCWSHCRAPAARCLSQLSACHWAGSSLSCNKWRHFPEAPLLTGLKVSCVLYITRPLPLSVCRICAEFLAISLNKEMEITPDSQWPGGCSSVHAHPARHLLSTNDRPCYRDSLLISPAVHEVVRHDLDPVDGVCLLTAHVDRRHPARHGLARLSHGLVYWAISRLQIQSVET